MITRRRDPDDERVVRIELTAEGQRLRGKARRVPTELACRTGFDVNDGRERTRLSRLRQELAELAKRIKANDKNSA